jgi:hypothetical protein
MLLKQQLLPLFFFIIFCSCQSTEKKEEKSVNDNKDSITLANRQYIYSVLNKGQILFKNNCTVCHCSPRSNCEDFSGFRFQTIFYKLPKDSLSIYMQFVSDSKAAVLKSTDEYQHRFGKTLDEKEIQTIIEFLWIECKL